MEVENEDHVPAEYEEDAPAICEDSPEPARNTTTRAQARREKERQDYEEAEAVLGMSVMSKDERAEYSPFHS